MNIEHVRGSQDVRKTSVCPWWIVHLLDNFLRPLIHNPQTMFGPYVKAGMKVLDIGCGRGFASLGLARLVDENGLVISADLQPEMLRMVKERAERAGLSNRIRIHRCTKECIGLNQEFDLAVAFFMIHEVPNTQAFLEELFSLLKLGGLLFIAEPKIHVKRRDFERMVLEAQNIGFRSFERPDVRFGRAVVLVKDVAAAIDT